MSAARLLIYGAGHLGRQVLHHLTHYSGATVLGYVDDTKAAGSEAAGGHRSLGGLDDVRERPGCGPGQAAVVFAIGYADMAARGAALRRVRAAGYGLFSVVHPRAIVEPGAVVGDGAIVLGGAIIDQNVRLGAGCFLDIGVRIGEDSIIGDGNYFSSGTAIGGSVRVGDDNFFGMDCTTVTGITIGSRCFVNAKALVARPLGDDVKLVEVHKSRELPMAARASS